jgi:hypothetical protein
MEVLLSYSGKGKNLFKPQSKAVKPYLVDISLVPSKYKEVAIQLRECQAY